MGRMRNSCDCYECRGNAIQPESEENRCKGCICDQLSRLQTQTEVDVFLLGGQILEDVVFITLNRNDCRAFFNDPTTEPGSTLIVDCQFIQAIRIEAD